MSDDAFVSKVREMRAAQKEYFKTRSYDVLNRSKSLEKEVDKIIEDKLCAQDALL